MEHELIDQVKALDPAPQGSDLPAGSWSATVVLRELDTRSSTMTDTTTRPTEPNHTSRWRPLLVAAAAFVGVLAVGAVIWLATRTNDTPPADVTTTTQAPTTTAASTESLDATMNAAVGVAASAGFDAESTDWDHQLTYEINGEPACLADTDPVDMRSLDQATSARSMTVLRDGESTGAIELLRFDDAATASEFGSVLERLLRTRRACISGDLQGSLGSAFGEDTFSTLEIDGILGGFLFQSAHDDGSGRTAHIDVVAGLEGDVMYVVTFRSNGEPADPTMLSDLVAAVQAQLR